MPQKSIGIIMNGITGRMGYRQHLVRSILPIREQGGVTLEDGTPRPGRADPGRAATGQGRRARRAARRGALEHRPRRGDRRRRGGHLLRRPGDLAAARRSANGDRGRQAHLHREADGRDAWRRRSSWPRWPGTPASPPAWCTTSCTCRAWSSCAGWSTRASSAGSCRCAASSATGCSRATSQPAQRPSWNYRGEDGGGMTVDMFCHWNYVLEGILGRVASVTATTATHIPTRWDENGQPYAATADDASYGIFELGRRRHRADQLLLGGPGLPRRTGRIPGRRHPRLRRRRAEQVRGTSSAAHTPKPVWNPDLPVTESFRDQWLEVPANADLDNGFKLQWEEFLRDVVAGRPHRFDLLSAARGVQLAELGLRVLRRGPPPGDPGDRAVTVIETARYLGDLTGARVRLPSAADGAPERTRSVPPARTRSAPITSRIAYAAAHVVPTAWADNVARRPGRHRLGRHAGLPARTVVLRARRRRRHGHRAARHGPGRGGHPRADHPQRGRGARRSAARWWSAPSTDHLDDEVDPAATAVIDAYVEQMHRRGRRAPASC